MATSPRRRHIGVDVDGVLANYVGAFADVCQTIAGRAISRHATTWDWFKTEGVTPVHLDAIQTYIEGNPMFWHSLADLPETLPVLDKLDELSADHSLYFITKRPANAKFWTEMWLSDKGMATPTVLVTSRDGLKGKLCQALDIDLFVDDKPENVLDVYRALPPSASVYLYAQPWNQAQRDAWQTDKGQGGVKVVTSLLDMLREEGL